MLVLSRKLQQQIKIGDEITVTVLRVKGNTVRIGVQAPRDVRVIRAELPKQPAGQEESSDAAAELVVALSESAEPLSEVCDESAITTTTSADLADEPPALARAPHLPLKRIRERFGKAPLKQVLASCPTLAK